MRVPGLGVLDRSVLREMAVPFALATAVFTLFLLLDRLQQLIHLVIGQGVPVHLVVQLMVFMLPGFLVHALPMALLITVLLVGGRMAGDLEVVAWRASGVSLVRLFRPALLATLAVVAVTGTLALLVSPLATAAFQTQLVRILETRAVAGLRERVFNTSFGDVVIYVEEISPSRVGLKRLVVSDERDPALTRIVTAAEGRLLTDERTNRIVLRLLDGAVNEADVAAVQAGEAVPEGLAPGGAASARRYRYTAFGVYDMTLTVEPPSAVKSHKAEKDLTAGELWQRMAAAPGPAERLPLEVELHKRLALALAPLAFVLLGFPLAVRSHRGGRSVALIATLGIVVLYHLLQNALENVALRGQAPAALALWLPDAVFAAAGAALLVLTTREWRPPAGRWLWSGLSALWQRLPRRPARRGARAAAGAPGTTLIIDRYLLRQYAAFVGLGLAVATALAIVVDLLDNLDRILRHKPPVAIVLEHFLYAVPGRLYHALPVVMLVATIFLFLSLSRWHELTALKAAGISLYRTSLPILLAGGGVALGAALFQELVLPAVNERGLEVDRVKIRGELPRHLRTRTRLWLRAGETRFYRVELLSPATGELHGLTVLDLDARFHLRWRLDALRARWTPAGWEVTAAAIREVGPGGQVATRAFDRAALALPERLQDFIEIHKPTEEMSFRELRDYVARLRAAGFEVRRYLVDLHAKVSEPVKNLVMVLVAIPFALGTPRAGRLHGVALAIALLVAYVVVDYSARSLGRADLLPAALAAWTANVIFLGVGASLLLRART
jgi:lipopolysaccharide export system permease protein